ncbi:MAG TPA: uroporphyrinogen-III synthase [Methylomirabilota bacterium]|nr:uroporphyrinogen-III synthase [Methylomirabilota bacterium]
MADTRSSSLAGKRIVITRAAAQSEALARELSARGAIPVVLPLVAFAGPEDFAPLDRAIAGIEQFDWMILTSAQAVRTLTQRLAETQQPLVRTGARVQVACVGPVTAEAARAANLPVTHVAATHNGVALAEELGSRLTGARVFLPRSDRANPDLPAALKRFGAEVTEVIAYRTLRPAETDNISLGAITRGEADAIVFFSPSAVHNFVALFGAAPFSATQDKLAITAVGPVTTKALREAGISRAIVATDTTAASVIETLERYFAETRQAAPAGVKHG